jgi:hypothetical protein
LWDNFCYILVNVSPLITLVKKKGPPTISIISGTGAASGQKLTLGLLASITLEIIHFCAYAQFPEFLSFFKCILEVMPC